MIQQKFIPKYTDSNKEERLFNTILQLFVERWDTLEQCVEQLQYCKEHYFSERDYNIAQSALVFTSNPEIVEIFAASGYYDIDRYTLSYVWFMWLNAVRDVANFVINEKDELAKIPWK